MNINNNVDLYRHDEPVYVIARTRAGGNKDLRYWSDTCGRDDCFRHKDDALKALGDLACDIFAEKEFPEYSREGDFNELFNVVKDRGSFEDDIMTYSVEEIQFRSLIPDRFPLEDADELADILNEISWIKVA